MNTFRTYLSVVVGTLLVVAAAFGVTEFTQPSQEWQLAIYAIAALALALYQRQQPPAE